MGSEQNCMTITNLRPLHIGLAAYFSFKDYRNKAMHVASNVQYISSLVLEKAK